MKFINRYFF